MPHRKPSGLTVAVERVGQVAASVWVAIALLCVIAFVAATPIAETTVAGERLVVRRTRLIGAQAELFADWRHFAFLTNRTEPIGVVEAEHRQHAVVELAIRDLKDQALAHFPSGHYSANSAWTVIACLTHNLLRWTSLLGLPGRTIRAARTLRRRLLTLPGRLTRNARQWTLHMPARWPWQDDFVDALARIRALPAAA